MKTIAIITPVFNSEKYILDCITSVASSILGEGLAIEHILIDDCSTDQSWDKIQSVALPHLTKLRLTEHSGASHSRNFGVQHTQADYIFCLDADDVIFQSSLRYLFDQIEQDGAHWVYGDFLRTDEELRYLPGQDYYGHSFDNPREVLTAMLTGWHFFQQNGMYRKSLFDHVGGFDESLSAAQDFDLFIRFLLERHLPVHVRAPLYLHRFHQHNLSKVSGRENNSEAHVEDIKKFYLKYEASLRAVLDGDQLTRIKEFLAK